MKPGTARALLVAACAAWIATGLGRAALDAFLGIPRDFGDIEAVERWRSWVTLLSWVSLAGTVAAVAGLIRLAFGGGTAAVAAAIGVVGMALVSATWMLLPVLDLDTGGLERFHTILPWLQLAVWALANGAMLATLWRFQARGPAFLVTSVLIGVGLAVWLLGLLDVLTPEAEQEWVDEMIDKARMGERFRAECTPGYYNNEGRAGNGNGFFAANYGAGPVRFFQILQDWRDDGSLPGCQLRFTTTPTTTSSDESKASMP